MNDRLKGCRVVVTGASRGIGFAAAEAFRESGCALFLISQKMEALESAKSKLLDRFPQNKSDLHIFAGDLGIFSILKKAWKEVERLWGGLDILLNNAARFERKSFLDITEEQFDSTMNLNVKAPFFCSQEAFRLMKSRGAIIQISSLAGIRSALKFKEYSDYVVSKFGVVGLTEALAEEGRERKISVLCIAPGAVETDMLKSWGHSIHSNLKPGHLGRIIVSTAAMGLFDELTGATIEVPSQAWEEA